MPYKPKTNSEKLRADPKQQWRFTNYEDERPSAAKRGYTSKWRKASKGYLKKHPLCVYCEKEGRTELATLVDHIIPHKGDKALFWDSKNWMSLCATCHNSTKRKEENKSSSLISSSSASSTKSQSSERFFRNA